MAEYALLTPTPVAEGAAVPYNTTLCKGCCDIRHRPGSGIVKVKGGTCCNPNRYHVQFHAVVRGVVGAMQLGLFLDGELLPETVMAVVSGAVANEYSVDAATEICIDGCCAALSARVIEGNTVTVNTANIIVHKEAA